MENRTYLPLGSVVFLKGTEKRVMIYGRRVVDKEGKEYDYQACPYPEGCMDNTNVIVFNHEDIRMIYFIGFQDIEELAYRQVVLVDGKQEKEEQTEA